MELVAHVQEWVGTDSAFEMTFTMMLSVFVLVFIASAINDNYSWVDRTWSVVPVLYAWVMAAYAVRESKRSLSVWETVSSVPFLFASAITLWGCRMTFNFYRRGGYFRGGEDYRWNHVRSWPLMGNKVVWTAFNFFVISLFQTWLLWAITLPVLSLPAERPTSQDVLLLVTFLTLLAFETLCDNQQWRFQNAKLRRRDGVFAYGFCVTGAFGYSRHLNVFCEASMWVTVATAAWLRAGSTMELWQWAGSVALVVLVHFSTGVITERLSKRKYGRDYAIYQQTTPMLLPAWTSTTERTVHLLEAARRKRGAKSAEAAP